MIHTTFCAIAILGFSNLGSEQPKAQESQSKAQAQPSLATRPEHHMSAGLSLELMQTLPPPYQGRFRTESDNRGGMYQIYTSGGLYPYYPIGPQYNSYVYPYGLGGYYPPGAGGRYSGGGGWWFW
jgi:hypothetical protein